jgi:hypothetical protein
MSTLEVTLLYLDIVVALLAYNSKQKEIRTQKQIRRTNMHVRVTGGT